VTPVTRLRADAERNLARILDAAGEVFAARGFDATLHDVAAHAGLGVGTVYRRFPDKQALVETLFEAKLDRIMSDAERLAAGPDPWEALVAVLTLATDAMAGDHGLHQMLNSGIYADKCGVAAAGRLGVLLEDLLPRAKAAGALRTDVTAGDIPVIMMMVGTVAQKLRDADPDVGRRYLDLVVDGLRARPDLVPLHGTAPSMDQLGAAKPDL
jgi:AcrR family transcriptional regulator